MSTSKSTISPPDGYYVRVKCIDCSRESTLIIPQDTPHDDANDVNVGFIMTQCRDCKLRHEKYESDVDRNEVARIALEYMSDVLGEFSPHYMKLLGCRIGRALEFHDAKSVESVVLKSREGTQEYSPHDTSFFDLQCNAKKMFAYEVFKD